MHQKILSSVLCLLLVNSISQGLAKEVCYSKYGCFSDDPPFESPSVPLPQSPSVVGITYRVFTRAQPTVSQIIDDSDVAKLQASDYNRTKNTVILVHGFNENLDVPWINIMKDALLKQEDVNIIIIDWSAGAKSPYKQAAGNTRVVGAQIAELIKFLVNSTNTNTDAFYILGFDLGAHAASHAGKNLGNNGTPLGRITGLDPVGRYFLGDKPEIRLDSSDAQFVDVIHTDSDNNGLEQELGHLDFYPNGGARQKGCGFLGDIIGSDSCDHRRAIEYFIESITTSCPFRAYPCKSMVYFERGWCTYKDQVNPSLGYNAFKSKGLTAGKHFLYTNSRSPFCVFHYTVYFKTGTGIFGSFRGRVTVRIHGENGATGYITLNKRSFQGATLNSFVVPSAKDLGTLKKLEVSHDGLPLITQWHLEYAIVKPSWSGNSNYYSACFDAYINNAGDEEMLQMGRPTDVCKT